MENLIAFKTDSGHTIYLEATETNKPGGGMRPVSINADTIVEKAANSFTEALEPVKSVSESIFNAFSGFAHVPDELEVELSIKITAEAGVIITKGSVEGNFKISLKWKNAQNPNG